MKGLGHNKNGDNKHVLNVFKQVNIFEGIVLG